jgi:hypothetical protein
MRTWKDVSSYSRDDKDRTPVSWQLKVGSMAVVVTRYIYAAKDEWTLSCPPFYNHKVLQSKDIDEAKSEAIAMVMTHLDVALQHICEVLTSRASQ